MEERKSALDLDKGEEQQEKKKVKIRRKKERVVSRFFQDGATNQQNQGRTHGSCKQQGEKKSHEKTERVVSRFFQEKQRCISGSHTERRKKRSHEKGERVMSHFFQENQGCISGSRTKQRKRISHEKPECVVSRFFQNREQEVGLKIGRCSGGGNHGCRVVDSSEIAQIDEPIASIAEKRIENSDAKKETLTSFFQIQEPKVSMKLSHCSKGGNCDSLAVVSKEIAETEKPAASLEEKRFEKSEVKKERVVSRFFQNQEPGVPLKLIRGSGLGNRGGVAALNIGREISNIDDLFSCFAYKKGCDSSVSNSKEIKLSTQFENREVKSDSGPIWKQIDRTDWKASIVRAKKEVGSRSRKAVEKNKEAYRRKDVNNTWKPPRSLHRLLQEDHAHDPWRVLVICMLLNLTTGRQARQILENLFCKFPDAKAVADAPEERIEEIIKTLGLQKKRARMIKRMSQEYLGEGWTHVTQLHGIGKYAADAYAIFCSGKWYEVTPEDHKLKDYWEYLWTHEDRF